MTQYDQHVDDAIIMSPMIADTLGRVATLSATMMTRDYLSRGDLADLRAAVARLVDAVRVTQMTAEPVDDRPSSDLCYQCGRPIGAGFVNTRLTAGIYAARHEPNCITAIGAQGVDR